MWVFCLYYIYIVYLVHCVWGATTSWPKIGYGFSLLYDIFFWEREPTIAGGGGGDSKTMFFYVYNLHSLYALLMGKGPTPKTSRSNTGSHVACIEIVCVEISLSI